MRAPRLGLLLALVAAASLRAEEIAFGILGTDSAAALRQNWNPFLADMAKETGLEVRGYFATDYAGLVEAMRFGKVQLAWLGNKAAIEAVDRAEAEVFAQFVDLAGRSGYHAHLIVHRDSPIRTLDELLIRGRTLTLGIGDPQSTSGTLVPLAGVFAPRGLDPRTAFRVVRSSTHGGNLLAVLNRQLDAATNNSEELDKLQLADPAKFAQVRILWTSEPIPRDPLVWRRDLAPAAKDRLRTFVLAYGKDDREKAVLARMQQIAGFRASDNRQLLPIRLLEFAQAAAKVTADPHLSPDERAARLAALDRRRAALEATPR